MRDVAIVVCLLAPALAGCLGADDTRLPAGDVGQRFGPFPPVDLARVEITNLTVESFDGTELAVTVFRPAHATPQTPVPVILHTPCLSCVRWTTLPHRGGPDAREGAPQPFLEAGFVVVSHQHRGQGHSNGEWPWHLPEVQGRDTLAVIDHVATLPFVALDAPGDPVVGMVGFSSGGIGQVVTALYETAKTGSTRIDALAPFSFLTSFEASFAPNGVPRSLLWDALHALWVTGGATSAGGVGEGAEVRGSAEFNELYAAVTATGSVPDGTGGTMDGRAWLTARGAFALMQDGVRLDVPVLAATAITDLFYPLQDATALLRDGLTPEARWQSVLAASYGGGHWLPAVQPVPPENACQRTWKGDVWALKLAFHQHHLLGDDARAGPRVQLATESACLLLDDLPALTATAVEGTAIAHARAATGRGAEPTLLPIAEGPLTLAGMPSLNATVTLAPAGARLFFALAAGPSPNEVRILGDQWMPIELDGPGDIEALEMAGLASTIQADETLYLVVARWVDQFAHHHDRVPGPVVLDGFEVGLPVVQEAA